MDWVRTEVDGVPTYWSDSGDEPRAGLVFRVGAADERLARRGITHLVEHLALYRLAEPHHHANGEVDLVTTTFTTHGTAEDVAGFLAQVCRSLTDLPTDRMAVEANVLRTEAAGRGGKVLGQLLLWRHGAATYGLPGYDECGVGHHTAEEVRTWARRWFTRGNAALWFVGGPPPAGLTLGLPDGPRTPPPVPTSALPRTPAYFQGDVDGVALGTVLDRTTAAIGYTYLLETRLHRELRVESGLSYSPATRYDPRDRDTAHVVAFADGLPDARRDLLARLLAEVDRLAEEPVDEAELATLLDRMREPTRHPLAPAGVTVAAARDEVLGAEPMHLDDYLDEVGSLTPDALRDVGRAARDNALLLLPQGLEPPDRRYGPAPYRSASTVRGSVLLSTRPSGDPGQRGRLRLVVGDEGVSLVDGPSFVTVRFAECELVHAYPDGTRHLVGRDGFIVRVDPTIWPNGRSLTAAIDRAVDPAVVIHRPAPEAPPSGPPVPAADRRRGLRDRLRRRRAAERES